MFEALKMLHLELVEKKNVVNHTDIMVSVKFESVLQSIEFI